ncbi:NAD+ synthase [bacterium]|nr:MAG: NAD+ synthase [bacterium]
MRIGIGQINTVPGDIEGNGKKMEEYMREGRDCDVVVFPELSLPGYIPKDIILRRYFVEEQLERLERMVKKTGKATVIGGYIEKGERKHANVYDLSSVRYRKDEVFYNAAFLARDGELVGKYFKKHLPSFDVYNEERYFTPGEEKGVFEVKGKKIGVNICEDIWYDEGPVDEQASLGAELIINISASPFYRGKPGIRRRLVSKRARENKTFILYVNLVGGWDEIVFDGGSFACDPDGDIVFLAPSFKEGLFVWDMEKKERIEVKEGGYREVKDAIVLGIRDYVRKNGFRGVVLGLSGGIDSAVVACLAVEALEKENVLAIFMPGDFTSPESREDAYEIAQRLGIKLIEVPISQIYHEFLSLIEKSFPLDTLSKENLQARIRGNILMAYANKERLLVLATGNKSEISIGYNTLYGDTVGAMAPLGDLYKNEVYEIARILNEKREIIPERVFKKPPSAELRKDQRDEDDIPPYAMLDPVLYHLIEENMSVEEIVGKGYPRDVVEEILRRYYIAEYKRKQIPFVIKVSSKAFGSGRRVPITHRYRK